MSPNKINSTYLMFGRLLAQKLAIIRDTDATDPAKANDLLLNDNEWATIREIVPTLKPFQLAKVVLYSVEDHVDSVSVVKPMICSFCTNFLSNGNETPSSSASVRLLKHIKDDLLTKLFIQNCSQFADIPAGDVVVGERTRYIGPIHWFIARNVIPIFRF